MDERWGRGVVGALDDAEDEDSHRSVLISFKSPPLELPEGIPVFLLPPSLAPAVNGDGIPPERFTVVDIDSETSAVARLKAASPAAAVTPDGDWTVGDGTHVCDEGKRWVGQN